MNKIPPPLEFPVLNNKKDLPSLARLLFENKDWEGTLQAISEENWKGWDELLNIDSLNHLLTKTAQSKRQDFFPELPWPISSDESWPDVSPYSAECILCGLLMAQNLLNPDQQQKLLVKARELTWAPILEQFDRIRQKTALSNFSSVWTESYKFSSYQHADSTNLIRKLFDENNVLFLKQVLSKNPQIIKNLTSQFISFADFKSIEIFNWCHNLGWRPKAIDLEPSVLERWLNKYGSNNKMLNVLPLLIWEAKDISVDEKINLSEKWFYFFCKNVELKKATVWLKCIQSLDPLYSIDWTHAISSIQVYNTNHNQRVKTLDQIDSWLKIENPKDHQALLFLAWINLSGKNYQSTPHGLERYRYSTLNPLKKVFIQAAHWLEENPQESSQIDQFAVHWVSFLFSSKGQKILSKISPDQEFNWISDALLKYSQKEKKTSFLSSDDKWRHISSLLTPKVKENWNSRHGSEVLPFWINEFKTSIKPLKSTKAVFYLSFLHNWIESGTTWSPNIDEKWIEKCELEIPEKNKELLEKWKSLSLKAKMNYELSEVPQKIKVRL